jgi:3-phenylpropionate/trans-cinnamate dioxygenase ferredoxin component
VGFVKVATLSDIGDGEVLGTEASGKSVCLARVGDVVYAFTNNCSHRDFPLSDGEVDPEDCSITCEWHGARFDIRTGKALSLPATRPIKVYDCKVEDGVIYVDVG